MYLTVLSLCFYTEIMARGWRAYRGAYKACGVCGGSPDAFEYRRILPLGSGYWTCPACGTLHRPNTIQGFFTGAEARRIRVLADYYSNHGVGDLYAHELVIACLWPRDTPYLPVIG